MSINFLTIANATVLNDILAPAAIIGGIAFALGILIAIVSRLFRIEINELQEDIMRALPMANCGACGFVGCEDYAKWLATGGKDASLCPVGGNELTATLSALIGVESTTAEQLVAHVMCKGTTDNTSKRYIYTGTKTCTSAHLIFSGPNSCTYGCMGFGDCVQACQFDAIDIRDGIAVINELKCTGCEQCIAACPKDIIFMVPKDNKTYKVECRNHWPGGETRKHCKVGCIGCQRCVKVCPENAIHMEENLAIIDPYKCTNCGKCYEVCPTKSISNPNELYAHF